MCILLKWDLTYFFQALMNEFDGKNDTKDGFFAKIILLV